MKDKFQTPEKNSKENSLTFSAAPIPPEVEDPNLIDAAIFYSISSTQKGLQGIDLGNQIIKLVANGLKSEFPLMSRYSSLSPIPNFTEYILSTIQSIQNHTDTKGFRKIWNNYSDLKQLFAILSVTDEYEFWSRLIQLLRSGNWITDQTLVELLREPLMRTCAFYLYNEKRRGFALNPVGMLNYISKFVRTKLVLNFFFLYSII